MTEGDGRRGVSSALRRDVSRDCGRLFALWHVLDAQVAGKIRIDGDGARAVSPIRDDRRVRSSMFE